MVSICEFEHSTNRVGHKYTNISSELPKIQWTITLRPKHCVSIVTQIKMTNEAARPSLLDNTVEKLNNANRVSYVQCICYAVDRFCPIEAVGSLDSDSIASFSWPSGQERYWV